MKDRFGRINNRHQTIGELDLIDMAYFLTMVSNYTSCYPNDYDGWKDWLEKESEEGIYNL